MTTKVFANLFLLFLLAIDNNLTLSTHNGLKNETSKTLKNSVSSGISLESYDDDVDKEGPTMATLKMLKNEPNQYLASPNEDDEMENQKMKAEASFSVKYHTPTTLTAEQIGKIAQQASSLITLRTMTHVKQIFSRFAPDSWLEALEDIPLSTIRCTVKVSTEVRLFQQQQMIALDNENDAENEEVVVSDGSDRESTKMPENVDNLGTLDDEEAAEIQTKEQLMNLLKTKCPRGFPQIVALNEAINNTLDQLPPHVHQIFLKYGKSFKNVSSFFDADALASVKVLVAELLEDLKSITSEEREQIGDVFPKLRSALTDTKIDQLLDQLKDCVNGNRVSCQNASQLAVQIWTSPTGSNNEEPSTTTKAQSSDSAGHFGVMKVRAKRQMNDYLGPYVDDKNKSNEQKQNDQPPNVYSPDDQPLELQFS